MLQKLITDSSEVEEISIAYMFKELDTRSVLGFKDFIEDLVQDRDISLDLTIINRCDYPKRGVLSRFDNVKFIDNDVENSQNIFGRTAYYDPNQHIVALYTMGRHPKDILRSFSHEMVHHEQNLEDRLNNINTTNTNEDGALPEIEKEAYEKGNMMLRNWEDNIKNV